MIPKSILYQGERYVLKTAFKMMLYHGTSSVFLRSILAKGLVHDPKGARVYDDPLFRRSKGQKSIESYPGVYVTDNFRTASGAAGDASRKFGGNSLIVCGKFETTAPDVRMDEDQVHDPEDAIASVRKVSSDWKTNYKAIEWIAMDPKDAEVEAYAGAWLEELGLSGVAKKQARLTSTANLAVRAFLDYAVALLLDRETEVKDDYYRDLTRLIKEKYSTVPAKWTIESAYPAWRKAFDAFLAATKSLQRAPNSFRNNFRSTAPIGFKGANRIQLIVEVIDLNRIRSGKVKAPPDKDIRSTLKALNGKRFDYYSILVVRYEASDAPWAAFLKDFQGHCGDKYVVLRSKTQKTVMPVSIPQAKVAGHA